MRNEFHLPILGKRLAVDLLAFRIQVDFKPLAAAFVNQLQDQPVFQGAACQADAAILDGICRKEDFRNFGNAGRLLGGRNVNQERRLGHGLTSLGYRRNDTQQSLPARGPFLPDRTTRLPTKGETRD